MKDLQQRQLESLRLVLLFLDHDVPEERRLAASRRRIAEAIPRIKELEFEQRRASNSLPADEIELGKLRFALRNGHLIPLARLGAEILQLKAGVGNALRVPKTRATDEVHVAAGDRFIEFLAPHVEEFVNEDQPRSFLKDLRTATDALRERLERTGEAFRRRTLATAELARAIPRARREIPIIEGILKARFASDSVLEGKWRHAKRVTARKGRPKKRPPRA